MRRATPVALLLAVAAAAMACGRVGFDPLQTDAAGGDGPTAGDAPAVLPCVSDGLACSGALAGIALCGGVCLAFCNEIVTNTIAADRCAAWGGELASVSRTDVSCIRNLPTNDAWIGLEQRAGATQLASEWTWVDGVAGAGLPWATNEPNDADGAENGEEQCALQDGGGGLIDTGCGSSKPFVCQRPAP